MEYYTKGCVDCVLFNNEFKMCNHPSIEGNIIVSNNIADSITPEWCPLRTEYLTIALKQPQQ